MNFSISLFQKHHPQAIARAGKDRSSINSAREIIIDFDLNPLPIFVYFQLIITFLVVFFCDEKFLYILGSFSKCTYGTQKPAISQHALQNIMRSRVPIKYCHKRTRSLPYYWLIELFCKGRINARVHWKEIKVNKVRL